MLGRWTDISKNRTRVITFRSEPKYVVSLFLKVFTKLKTLDIILVSSAYKVPSGRAI